MALGTVITAKGKRMDFADLVRKSRTPINQGDMKDKVVRQTPPAKELRARGHMPSHAGVAKPVLAPVIPAPDAAAPVRRVYPDKSMVDYTSITIDEPKHIKEKPDDAQQSANDTLVEILGNDMKTMSAKQQAKIGRK